MIYEIEIKNIKTGLDNSAVNQFIVDRRTPLGNPFQINSSNDRKQVCEQYKHYFYTGLLNNAIAVRFLKRMKEALIMHGYIELFCWCAPLQCHAETIKDYLLEQVKQ